jgi:hypothetical protein
LDTFFSPTWMLVVEQRRSSCRDRAKESISPVGARTDFKIGRVAPLKLLIIYRAVTRRINSPLQAQAYKPAYAENNYIPFY